MSKHLIVYSRSVTELIDVLVERLHVILSKLQSDEYITLYFIYMNLHRELTPFGRSRRRKCSCVSEDAV